jgi:hypothetical protein
MTELVNGAAPEATPVEPASEGNRLRDALAAGAEPSPAADDVAPNAAQDSALKRAEELEDLIAARVAAISSACARTAIQLAAHIREAAEDVWAEAQDIRRGRKVEG